METITPSQQPCFNYLGYVVKLMKVLMDLEQRNPYKEKMTEVMKLNHLHREQQMMEQVSKTME